MNNIEQYRKRFNMLIESSIGNVRPIISEQEGEYEQDAPNWDRAKQWAMSKPNVEESQHEGGVSTTGILYKGYSSVKWTEGDSNFTIFNGGNAREFSISKHKFVNEGNWKWNGNEVIFSWIKNSTSTADVTDCPALYAEAEKQTTYNPANLAAGKVVIGKGNQGALVRVMQCYLNQKNEELSLGLSPLKVDGIFGGKTKEMTIKFQQQFPDELKPDGIIGKNTYVKFGISS